ncbi:MAG: CPXCG motif-containing cysteine-rich protein [Candidatus Sumerlaeaceae bacterium]
MPSSSFACAHCGAENGTEIDASAGRHQTYVEDCQTCCRPNLLHVELDEDGEPLSIEAQPENG